MNVESKYYRLLLVSPWTLLVFLILPVLVILSVSLNIRIPLLGSTTPLLVNNICFACVAVLRLIRYLLVLNKTIRYGSTVGRPVEKTVSPFSLLNTRSKLVDAGFAFTPDGAYGESRDTGIIGTAIMYGGLVILLSVGSWDNLRQFSGILLDGIGPATNLNTIESYRSINNGPFPAIPKSLPRLVINNQYLPDSTYPMGASEVTFLHDDGTAENRLIKPREPVKFGAYDIYMSKLVYEAQIVIKNRDSAALFDSIVRLDPLVQKRGAFSFYGSFDGYGLVGGVYYQPEKSSLMIVVSRGGKKVVTDMVFQVDQQATQGEYVISCSKMGQWSEIRVIHRRHKEALLAGAALALLGLLLRIVLCPQRVWLEESEEGCIVSYIGTRVTAALSSDSQSSPTSTPI